MGQQALNSCLSYMENNGLGNDELDIQIANYREILYPSENSEIILRTERQALALSLVDAIIERDQRLGDVPAILICPSIAMIRTSHISICPERILYLRNYYTSDDRNNVSTRLRDLLYSATTIQQTNNVLTLPTIYVRNQHPILELQYIAVVLSIIREFQDRQQPRIYVRNQDPIMELQDIAVVLSRTREYQDRQHNLTIQIYQNGNFQYYCTLLMISFLHLIIIYIYIMFSIIEGQLLENGQRVLSTLDQAHHNDNLSNITSYISQYISHGSGVANRSIDLFHEGYVFPSQVPQSLPSLDETELMVDEQYNTTQAILLQAVESIRRGSPHRHDLYQGLFQ